MIRYALLCDQGHETDSWFQSAAAFDRLAAGGLLACAMCGSAQVEKALMAPAVRPAEGDALPALDRTPKSEVEKVLAALRAQVEENSDYVGLNFAAEARAIHDGTSPQRSIHGEARPEEARKLIEEGIPVAPLPFLPVRKTN